METKKKLKIDVYTDVICPWCWLGKRRLEKALEAVPGVEPDIHYLPYELRPDTPEEGIDRMKHLKAKYGAGIEAMDARITGFGKEVGLDYHFDKAAKIPNTIKAHRVIWFAGKEGFQKPVTEALHEAYFRDGKDIGDNKVLAEVAAGAGMDKGKVEKFLNSDQGTEEVRELEEKSYNLGISGVPFFVFDDKSALSGAHPVEAFISILKEFSVR
jgi:predicted DsbA family dithiol-disulfide isomerase